MSGLAYISSIPALSAPSANSFTLRSVSGFIGVRSQPAPLQDVVRGFPERRSAEVGGPDRPRLVVAVVNEDGGAARAPSGLDVLPSVAHHEARTEVHTVAGGGLGEHAGGRRAAPGLAP